MSAGDAAHPQTPPSLALVPAAGRDQIAPAQATAHDDAITSRAARLRFNNAVQRQKYIQIHAILAGGC